MTKTERTMGLYAATIFLSAFLLFAVQPLMSKYILPWFGEGPGVWTACMLFFQCVLLVGYSYAHLISSRLGPSRQAVLHLGALALSLLLLPITLDPSWKPAGAEPPTRHILALLVANIGVPFALLSSTGPLLSRWFSQSFPERSPYRLYALSNAGSLLALLSYPFIVERFLTLRAQAWIWSVGYCAFVLLCGACAWRFGRSGICVAVGISVAGSNTPPSDLASKGEPDSAPGNTDMVLWLALAASASVMLLATTHQVSQDLAVIPLLWVLPLAIYLLSFILCFDHDWWYKRLLFGPLLAAAALAAVYVMSRDLTLSAWVQISVYLVALFACCMVSHRRVGTAQTQRQLSDTVLPHHKHRRRPRRRAGGSGSSPCPGGLLGIPPGADGYMLVGNGMCAAGLHKKSAARHRKNPDTGQGRKTQT